MAELHVIGSIAGASGFDHPSVFCKWGVVAGQSWEQAEGPSSGQTQCDYPSGGEPAVWSHPVDIHYFVQGIAGWPRLFFQVWSRDDFGRNDIAGYGFCHVPASPGMYDIECPTWLPEGSAWQKFSQKFVGGGVRLKYEDVVHNTGDRFRLQTQAKGVVHLKLGVLFKDFDRFGVSTGS